MEEKYKYNFLTLGKVRRDLGGYLREFIDLLAKRAILIAELLQIAGLLVDDPAQANNVGAKAIDVVPHIKIGIRIGFGECRNTSPDRDENICESLLTDVIIFESVEASREGLPLELKGGQPILESLNAGIGSACDGGYIVAHGWAFMNSITATSSILFFIIYFTPSRKNKIKCHLYFKRSVRPVDG